LIKFKALLTQALAGLVFAEFTRDIVENELEIVVDAKYVVIDDHEGLRGLRMLL
jgi:hypothetical protein